MSRARNLLRLWLNAEVAQISFTLGAVFGMIAMAVLLTVPRVLMLLLGVVR